MSSDLTNNNFSGVIPTSLQLKKGLVFKYVNQAILLMYNMGQVAIFFVGLNSFSHINVRIARAMETELECQKVGYCLNLFIMVYRYDGNQFLCLASSGSCSSNSSSTPPTPSQSSSKENQTPLVIGVVSGVVVVVVLAVIAIICVCFCKEHKSGQQTSSNQNNGNTKLTPNSAYEDNGNTTSLQC